MRPFAGLRGKRLLSPPLSNARGRSSSVATKLQGSFAGAGLGGRDHTLEPIHAGGYDPVHAYGEPLWEKCHCGSIHTHRGALDDIEKDRRPSRRDR